MQSLPFYTLAMRNSIGSSDSWPHDQTNMNADFKNRETLATQLLNLDHRKQVHSIVVSRDTIMGIRPNPEYSTVVLDRVDRYLAQENDKLMFGAFDTEGRLRSFLAMRFWQELPYWTLHMLKTAPISGGGAFDARNNGVGVLFERALALAESRKHFSYYSCTTASMFGRLSGTISRQIPRIRECYELRCEERVPVGKISRYSIFANLLGNQQWNQEMIVFSRSLKNEFREN